MFNGTPAILPKRIDLLSPAASGNTLLNGLISYWELNESAGNSRLDSHSSNHFLEGTTVPTRAGINGTTAANFVPTDYLHLPSGSETDFRFGDSSFSFLVWVLYDDAHSDPTIMKYSAGAGGREFALFRDSGSNVAFYTSANGTAVTGYPSITSVAAGAWNLFYCYHDHVNDIVGISMNAGTPVTMAYTGGIHNGTEALYLGNWAGSSGALDGGIQKLGFWNRVLDMDNDVIPYYNSGNGLIYPEFASAA